MSLTLLPAVDVADGAAVRLVQGAAGSRDLLRRPARGRARLAARRRRVDPPRRPRRRLRARRQPRAAGRRGAAAWTSPSSCPAASATTPRSRRRWRTGCARVNLGTAALESPDWVRSAIARHGDRIAVGLDVRGTTLAARGWTQEGGDLWETMARLDADGCARYVVTDVHRDGTLTGPNLAAAARRVRPHRRPRSSRAAGSRRWTTCARSPGSARVEGAIVGKALYAGAFTLPEALAAVR